MSTLLLNTLTGKTSAGSIVVTGEGGSTTTNMQQGLAKQFINIEALNYNPPNIENSFNVASLTDHDTGLFGFNTTNNFANVKFASAGCHDVYTARAGAIESSDDRGNTTSQVKVRVGNSSGTAFDSREIMFTTHGDLA